MSLKEIAREALHLARYETEYPEILPSMREEDNAEADAVAVAVLREVSRRLENGGFHGAGPTVEGWVREYEGIN